MGWYHSHPHGPALPSLQDIDMQMDYQLRLQGSSNGFQPCLALLCCESRAGPYARARARLLRHRAPQAQPLSLSSCSPVLLWQPRRGVQDLTLLGDAPAGGRWRRRGGGVGRPRALRAGRGPVASALGPGTWGPLALAVTGWGT